MQNEINENNAVEAVRIDKSDTGTSSRVAFHIPYIPGIDGLRAIAVIAVLFYHAEYPWMLGGFLGVEVFFVISGYLITGLLLSEWKRTGHIKLGNFWFRRARRLLPAVFVLLLAVLAYAVIFLPSEVASLRFDVLAAAAYVSNWYQIFSHRSYFEAIGRPPLLRHLWSLAVEEQFYLIWPPLLLAGLIFIKPKNKLILPILVLIMAAGSTLLMASLYQPDGDPSRIYYGTDTRAAGFLIGAALSMVVTPGVGNASSRRIGVLLDIGGTLSLVALLVIFVVINEVNPLLYQGGFAVVALLTAMVILATVYPGRRLLPTALGQRLLTWMGTRSYSIYLWHWPIFDLTRPRLDIGLDGLPLMLMRCALTALLAELSYRYVEQPIRSGALGRMWKQLQQLPRTMKSLPYALAACVVVVLFVFLGVSTVNAKPPEIPAEYQDDPVASLNATFTPAAIPTVTTKPVQITSQTPEATGTSAPLTAGTTVSVGLGMPVVTGTASITSEMQNVGVISVTSTPSVTTNSSGAISLTVTANMTTAVNSVKDTATPAKAFTPAVINTAIPVSATLGAVNVSVATQSPVTPAKTVTDVLGSYYRILAVGDSVMLGASNDLHDAFGDIEVNAVVSRQASAAIALLQERHDAGTMGDIVIVHIGSNGFFTAKQFSDMMQILSNVRIVAIVNVRVPRRWEEPNNALFADGVKNYPNAVLVDWFAASDSHEELFVADGVHPQPAGRRLYADLILSQVVAAIKNHGAVPNNSQQVH